MATRAAEMAQVNFRINRGLKQLGDTVLARMDISFTQLVRAVGLKGRELDATRREGSGVFEHGDVSVVG